VRGTKTFRTWGWLALEADVGEEDGVHTAAVEGCVLHGCAVGAGIGGSVVPCNPQESACRGIGMPIAAPLLSGFGGTKVGENTNGRKGAEDLAFGCDACLEGALSGEEICAGDRRPSLLSELPWLMF
jgi:hypothetical protein